MKLNNKVYDILSMIAKYILPGLGTFYFAIAGIWGLPYGEQITGTITALVTLLFAVLRISKGSYNKEGMDGVLEVDETGDATDVYSLILNIPFEQISSQKKVMLSVNKKLAE